MTAPQKPTIKWQISRFQDLTNREVHDLLKLRVDVFVVEQSCPYPEIDGHDPGCWQVLGKNENGDLQATARIAPEGSIYPEASVGRVAVVQKLRGLGYGKILMMKALVFIDQELKCTSVKIAAQLYLQKFYSELGFEQISETYPWDGIDHIDMRLIF